MPTYRLPDGSDDTPDEAGRHTATANVLHSAEQYKRFPGCTDCRTIFQLEDPAHQALVAEMTAHIHPVVDRAVITETPAEPGEWGTPAHWTVRTVWKGEGLDRTDGSGWAVKLSQPRLAARLAEAIEAGAAVEPEGVGIDNAGRTYVVERSHVLARMMDADLRRLGF